MCRPLLLFFLYTITTKSFYLYLPVFFLLPLSGLLRTWTMSVPECYRRIILGFCADESGGSVYTIGRGSSGAVAWSVTCGSGCCRWIYCCTRCQGSFLRCPGCHNECGGSCGRSVGGFWQNFDLSSYVNDNDCLMETTIYRFIKTCRTECRCQYRYWHQEQGNCSDGYRKPLLTAHYPFTSVAIMAMVPRVPAWVMKLTQVLWIHANNYKFMQKCAKNRFSIWNIYRGIVTQTIKIRYWLWKSFLLYQKGEINARVVFSQKKF